ncbi:NAD(P)H-binding protein [bacterium]|nr:NAD(P)H-binding protein [bacterium]
MPRILIIGAHGQIAQVATPVLLAHPEVSLTLFLRRANRLEGRWPADRVRVVEGDATDPAALQAALRGQDVVYANLSGDMARQARAILTAMRAEGVRRLIFVSSMGICGEVPGETYRSVLDPYRDAALAIEASEMDYTILRPAWLNDDDTVAYGTTRKGQPFVNPRATVSRRSVADLIEKLALTPGLESRQSLGIHGEGNSR